MKTIALVLVSITAACAPSASQVRSRSTTTVSAAPACKEIAVDGKPARCEPVPPSMMRLVP